LTARDDRAGRKFQCPRCGREGIVPEPEAPRPAASQAEEEPSEEFEPVRFERKREADEGIDMTPMVDVTFLLLIFFMVTAAYALQKSIEVPPPDREESAAQARTYDDYLENDDFVIVRIARDNTVWVNEQEAPSEQEVLVKLREAREGPPGSSGRGPTSLLVVADSDALHETVVMCLDAGTAVGMENMRLSLMDEEDF
jgi:biopolymer transport protein ExbD